MNISKMLFSKSMSRKIVKLFEMKPGWGGPNSLAINQTSFYHFVNLWEFIKEKRAEPFITIVFDGCIFVQWSAGNCRNSFEIEFTDTKLVFYCLCQHGCVIKEGACKDYIDLAKLMVSRKDNPFLWKEK